MIILCWVVLLVLTLIDRLLQKGEVNPVDQSALLVKERPGSRNHCHLSALMHGLKVAGETGADELIWLHGVQPVEFDDPEEFLQIMERGFSKVRFSVMDLGGGPNRLLEQIQSQVPVASAGRSGNPNDLARELLEAAKPSGAKFSYRTSAKSLRKGKKSGITLLVRGPGAR